MNIIKRWNGGWKSKTLSINGSLTNTNYCILKVLYIRRIYIGVTWITIAVYSYNISIAILAHASASAKAWWWFFESYPQQAAMMSRLWYPPGQRSTLKKLESLILLFPLYKNIIFHSMFLVLLQFSWFPNPMNHILRGHISFVLTRRKTITREL